MFGRKKQLTGGTPEIYSGKPIVIPRRRTSPHENNGNMVSCNHCGKQFYSIMDMADHTCPYKFGSGRERPWHFR